MNSIAISYIRTYAPLAAGAVLSFLVTLGIEIDKDTQAAFIIVLTGLLQASYYAVARMVERKWPQVGTFLLGSSKQPVYREVQ